MLTKQRHEIILKLLEEKGSITVPEVRELLDTSESTVRRDITALDQEGKLTKVFGGAVALDSRITTYEYTVAEKNDLSREEKQKIARYAASLIAPKDFVYLDAGTTTAFMIDYIDETTASFVTNAVSHAQRLAARGMKVILLGGELKASTEAVIGAQAMQMLVNYHFTRGFFGANGVTRKSGYTTPDASEAIIKRTACGQCEEVYMLCDSSKFGKVSSVTFASFEGVNAVTEKRIPGYEECENIRIAE